MMTPGIRALSMLGHEVSVAIDKSVENYYLILKDNPYIKEIYDYNLVDKTKFDKYIDLSFIAYKYEMAGLSLPRVEIFNKALGVKPETNVPTLALKKKQTEEKSVCLHFSAAEERRSLKENVKKSLIKSFKENNYKIYLVDKRDNVKPDASIIDLSDLNILEAAKQASKASLFIGVDSSWMHIFSAFETKSVILFSSTKPETRIVSNTQKVIYTNSECRGCFYKSCQVLQCVENLTSEYIINELKKEKILL